MPSYDHHHQVDHAAPAVDGPLNLLPDYTQGMGNQGLLSQIGLGGLDTVDEGLPIAGQYDGLCRNPLILVSPATWMDELVVDAAIAAKATDWGVSTLPSVRMAQGGTGPTAAQVIELLWPATWGAAPVGVGSQDAILEASMSVGACTEQPGWAHVSTANQNRINRLLGGVTNATSMAARSEWFNRLHDANWSSYSPQQQGQEMVGLLSSDSARPGLTSGDTSQMAQANFSQTGPVEQTGHSFVSGTADALVYTLTFDDGQVVTVYAPKTIDSTDARHRHTVGEVGVAIAKLPPSSRKVVVSVSLEPDQNPSDAYWAREYNTPGFESYMTAGAAGEISIYPTSSVTPNAELEGSMIHETGHTWSMSKWGSDETQGEWLVWQAAVDSDGISLSNYATNSLLEDVAETIQIYGMTMGTPEHQEYRSMVPSRFAILDREWR